MPEYTNKTKSRVQKHPRINLAFYDKNLDYVQEAAWKAHKSVTQYINDLIEADRKANEENIQTQ